MYTYKCKCQKNWPQGINRFKVDLHKIKEIKKERKSEAFLYLQF